MNEVKKKCLGWRKILTFAKYGLFYFLMFCSFLVNAQSSTSSEKESTQGLTYYSGSIYHAKKANADIDGTVYVSEGWKKGSVINALGNETPVDQLQYDVYNQKILFVLGGQIYSLNEDLNIKEFRLGHKVFEKRFISGENKPDFFEVLSDNSKIGLLKRYKCTLVKGKASTGALPGRNDMFVMDTELYVEKEGGALEKIKPNKGNVLDLMDDKSDKIVEFAKSNKLNYRKEQDLTRILNFYDSL
ncbi:hypothetical protein SAMN04488029_1366 [Reichenbachiella faecimaris]|uniref:Uncharacterized protein n=1 Tax=Reichenbachiella faecimaris TaxID=692418 RepID=A0A1W2G8Q0_REIFA|nr:hypothetical protein [Reichenbachiella faecimaris]SMD33003.1 hypothetical protein SAMN04488029_1366 [Reichenbachiella faecimaris]